MSNILSIKNLNTTVNHEPRLEDTLIGKALGFPRPRKIRDLIKANQGELEAYGSLAPIQGESRGQSFLTYHLNEAQCLLLCMFSRTDKAAEVRKAIIDVFMDYRRGGLEKEKAVDISKVITDQVTHVIFLQNQLRKTKNVMQDFDITRLNVTAQSWLAERMLEEIYAIEDGMGTIAECLYSLIKKDNKTSLVK